MLCKKPYAPRETYFSKGKIVKSNAGRGYGCGQCIHCRVNQKREWTHRLILENELHDKSAFVTLTYNPENLPEDGNLQPDHLTKFLKRLRKRVEPRRLRYYAVGEYGEKSERPHFHLIIFGLGEDEQKVVEKAWPLGYVMLGDVSKDSAAYVADYCTKGFTKARDSRADGKVKEFMRCSKKPGLGAEYMKKIALQMSKYPHQSNTIIRELQIGRKKLPLGRYLTQKLAEEMCNVQLLEEEKCIQRHEEYYARKENREGIEVERKWKDRIAVHRFKQNRKGRSI